MLGIKDGQSDIESLYYTEVADKDVCILFIDVGVTVDISTPLNPMISLRVMKSY